MRTLPHAWRRALEALVAATARAGRPWSCPDAEVTLIPPGDRAPAELQVKDASGAGGVRRRSVGSPADVVPLGEAMLARALPPEPEARDQELGRPSADLGERPQTPTGCGPGADDEIQATVSSVNRPVPPFSATLVAGTSAGERANADGIAPVVRHSAPPSGLDLRVDLLLGTRYTGPTRAVLLGPELRAVVGVSPWSVGLVARYDGAVAFLQTVPDQFSLSSVTVGLTGGYRLLATPVELSIAVEPTMAVVLMGAQRWHQNEPDIDARVDLRLGARLSATAPVGDRLRFVGALGGEGAPAALFCDRHARRHALPSIPGYLAGLSLGVELQASR